MLAKHSEYLLCFSLFPQLILDLFCVCIIRLFDFLRSFLVYLEICIHCFRIFCHVCIVSFFDSTSWVHFPIPRYFDLSNCWSFLLQQFLLFSSFVSLCSVIIIETDKKMWLNVSDIKLFYSSPYFVNYYRRECMWLWELSSRVFCVESLYIISCICSTCALPKFRPHA